MKSYTGNIFFISLLCFLFSTFCLHAQTKRALIVAIGSYPVATGWPSISSVNDVPLIESALTYQGFTKLTTLSDATATKKGIVSALQKLIVDSQLGDKIVIHFSSHGQQITDDSTDEPDGLDEAIVCFGAPTRANISPEFADYDGSQHLRDDEINELIGLLRNKLGRTGDILLIVDACHSGTISRGSGLANIRGGAEPFIVRGSETKPRTAAPSKQKPFLAATQPARPRSNTGAGFAPYVVISASRANEPNYEYLLPDGRFTSVGSLSYVVNKCLRSVGPNETYHTLFSRIASAMNVVAPKQTPEIDGDYDRELFGGKAVQQQFYYVAQTATEGGMQLTIPAGQVETINVGAKVRVCPVGTVNPMTVTTYISGTVVQAGLFSAIIRVDKPVSTDPTQRPWVFITERSYGDLSVRVSIDSLRTDPLRSAIVTQLQTLPLVKLATASASELYVTAYDSARSRYVCVRKTTDGFVVGDRIPASSANVATTVRERIENYAQGKFLHLFSSTNPAIRLTLDLLPVRAGGSIMDTLPRADYMRNGLLQVVTTGHQSDSVAVRVTNAGSRAVYFSLLDIQPDGIVNILFPALDRVGVGGYYMRDSPANYYLKPGEERLIPVKVGFSPPYGKETFKLMASPEAFDLRNIVNMRHKEPTATRALTSPLEQLFGSAQLLTRGGGTALPTGAEPIGTFDYPFLIVPHRIP